MVDGHETVNILPDLADAPSSYTDQGGKIIAVKATEDGVEFIEPSGGASFTVSYATVFSGASPTSWTDLDLSGTVGANSAFVILGFEGQGDMDALAVRKNGDANEYYNTAIEALAYGCALGHHDSSAVLVLMCVTDTSGVIEWITESSQTTAVILIAYIK